MDELIRARVDKATRAADVEPSDLLRAIALDIEQGRIRCDGVVVLTADRPEVEVWTLRTMRAGVERDQELVLLRMAEERCIRNWIGS